MTSKQKEVRLALLVNRETLLMQLINASHGIEAVLLQEGMHAEATRQRGTTLDAKPELDLLQVEIRATELAAVDSGTQI